jgi:hypothetical protein
MGIPYRSYRVALAALAAVLLTVVAQVGFPQAAHASVTWSSSNPREVYTPGETGFYAYAPSAVSDGGHTYYYTCHNQVSGTIQDHVWFTQADGGTIQQDAPALTPSSSGWDSEHNCDPSVVAGTFNFSGNQYSYAMFYLGTDMPNSHNQIGVAFAKSLAGPWVKDPNPIVADPDSDTSQWGVGQPSATTVDPNSGRVLLFYTRGDQTGTHAYRRDLVLGNMDSPQIGDPVEVTTAGLKGTDGGQDVLHNFDMAYDPTRDRFYVAREVGPPPTDEPSFISSQVEVDSIPGADIWNGTGTWSVEGDITPSTTGFPRNHNPGILRTIFGTLPDSSKIDVLVTRSATGTFPQTFWTYNLWDVSGTIS